MSSPNTPPKSAGEPVTKRNRKHNKPSEPAQPNHNPSTVRTAMADAAMVLLSPHIESRQGRWREHQIGRSLEVRIVYRGSSLFHINMSMCGLFPTPMGGIGRGIW